MVVGNIVLVLTNDNTTLIKDRIECCRYRIWIYVSGLVLVIWATILLIRDTCSKMHSIFNIFYNNIKFNCCMCYSYSRTFTC